MIIEIFRFALFCSNVQDAPGKGATTVQSSPPMEVRQDLFYDHITIKDSLITQRKLTFNMIISNFGKESMQ